MIEIKVNDNYFETETPMKAYSYLVALVDYGFDEGHANEISELIRLILDDGNWMFWDKCVNVVDLVHYVCENYNELPDDFDEIVSVLEGAL